MLDIDDFKKINDTYGHIVGDFVLARLARVLTKIVGGAGNVVARFGGEEFIISIIGCSKELLLGIAEEIRKSAEGAGLIFRRKKIDFTISLGVVLYPDDGADSLRLTDTVDKRLYKAKKEGKNRVCSSG